MGLKKLNTKSKKSKNKYIIKKATIKVNKTNIANSSNARINISNKKVQKKKEAQNIKNIELELKSKNKPNSKTIK